MFGIRPLNDRLKKAKQSLEPEMYSNLLEGSMGFLMQMWERVCCYFIQNIIKSSEKPMGTVCRVFPRFEFQTSKGNAPHMHVVVWTREDKHDSYIRHKVSGSLRHLINDLRIELWNDNSVIKSFEDYEDLIETANYILTHECKKGENRCHKKKPTYPGLLFAAFTYRNLVRNLFSESLTDHIQKNVGNCWLKLGKRKF